jgi:hypothetical protein
MEPYVHNRPDSQLIQIKTTDFVVKAPLPDSIPFFTSNEVNETFDFFKMRSKLLQTFSQGAEINIDRGLAERSFWRSITNQDITFELNFDMYYSGEVDVVLPVKRLLLMSSPIEKQSKAIAERTEVFNIEGAENLGNYWSAPSNPKIIVGDIYQLEEVLIKNVNVIYSNKIDRDGNPISAVVSITVITREPLGRGAINKNLARKNIL